MLSLWWLTCLSESQVFYRRCWSSVTSTFDLESDPWAAKFLRLLTVNGLVQHVKTATHDWSRTLTWRRHHSRWLPRQLIDHRPAYTVRSLTHQRPAVIRCSRRYIWGTACPPSPLASVRFRSVHRWSSTFRQRHTTIDTNRRWQVASVRSTDAGAVGQTCTSGVRSCNPSPVCTIIGAYDEECRAAKVKQRKAEKRYRLRDLAEWRHQSQAVPSLYQSKYSVHWSETFATCRGEINDIKPLA